MADLPITFMTFPEDPLVGIISCPAPYIRKRILDYLRICAEVESCGRLYPFGAEIYFYVNQGHTPTEIVDRIDIICPMFIAEGTVRRSWIRRNFWLLWGAVFGLLCLVNTVDHIIEGSMFDSVVSWGVGMLTVVFSLMNYAKGVKHEKALLSDVHEKCIEIMKKEGVIK